LLKDAVDSVQSPFIIQNGYTIMKNLIMQESETELVETEGVPICGSNFTNPITNRSQFLREIHYRIGDKLYIENAD
jgi:hypothetical protein